MPSDENRTSQALNPYAVAPPPQGTDRGESQASTSKSPVGITITGVLSIVAGMMNGLFSVATVFNLIFGDRFMGVSVPASGERTAQQQMVEQLQALGAKYAIFNGIIGVASFVLAVALLVGGIGLMMTKPWSRMMLRRVFLAAICLEVLAGIVYVITQIEMMPIMTKFMGSMNSGNGNNLEGAMATSFMQLFTYIGMAIWLFWALGKCALFIWGRRYLNKPHVTAYLKSVR